MVKTTMGVKIQYLFDINSNTVGETIEDIKLMRNVLNPEVKIKASEAAFMI
ncbi:MAG: hypothetical protein NTV16_02400 [Actinobacteria bacterium]|nr:hypothetical protein [Actinomycetota bacterium]